MNYHDRQVKRGDDGIWLLVKVAVASYLLWFLWQCVSYILGV